MAMNYDGKNVDPHNNKRRLENWEKHKELPSVSDTNSKIIKEYLNDMKSGEYTARKKPLGVIRLNSIRQRIVWIANTIQKTFKQSDITKTTRTEATKFFNELMRKGKIKNRYGTEYLSVDSYANNFAAFWHWYMRKQNEKGADIKDITTYIDKSPPEENVFVYFTIDDLKKVASRAKYEYKVQMWFLFDSGIRAPTEMMNIKVSDLSLMENSKNYELNIRAAISKTFGRKIKLLLCSDMLREYIETNKLKDEDYLFKTDPRVVNQYLKRIFIKVLGKKQTKAGEPLSKINMYDFRHCSACYWLPRYKSESALKYRFGWKKSDMIHYYTKVLGMQDTIAEQDLLLDSEVKTKLEKELDLQKQNNGILEDKMKAMSEKLDRIDWMFNNMQETSKRMPKKGDAAKFIAEGWRVPKR